MRSTEAPQEPTIAASKLSCQTRSCHAKLVFFCLFGPPGSSPGAGGPLGGQSGSEKSIFGQAGSITVDRIWPEASFGQFWTSFGQATAILDEATAILDEATAILDDGCGRSGYRSLSL